MANKPPMKYNADDMADARLLTRAFGNRVKQELVFRGKTMKWLADLMDCTPSHLSKVLTGKYNVSAYSMARIANALEVQLEFTLDNVVTRGNVSLEVVNPGGEMLYKLVGEYENIG